MENLYVRKAHVSDAEGIAKVHVYTWQNAYLGLIPDSILQGLSVELRTSNWIRNIENPSPKSHTFIAEMNGEIVGFVGLGANREKDLENEGEIYAIYVNPQFQGRGAGAVLMQTGLETLRSEGFAEAVLWVLARNLPARAWYESNGWRSEGKTKFDQRGDLVLEEIEYRIELKF